MNQERLLKVLRAPHVSEKATHIDAEHGQYVFKVRIDATKPEIKKAIELVYEVEVKAVRTLVRKGKTKRTARGTGKRSDLKLAYVSLEAGHDIDFADAE